MKKRNAVIALGLTLVLLVGMLAGCGQETTTDTIYPVTREDGSGTRGAFIELFGIEQKDADGNKVDYTTDLAEITNSTSVMMTTIAGNTASIGYVSPEAALMGPLLIVEQGDIISYDIDKRTIQLELSDEEIQRRLDKAELNINYYPGWLGIYQKAVGSITKGGVLSGKN